jgi:putative FmdB family regulatory protein
MPFYDFRCTQCEHTFTVRATFQEKEAGLHPPCPVCSAIETRQMLAAGIFIGHAIGGFERSFPSVGQSCGCGPGGCCG